MPLWTAGYDELCTFAQKYFVTRLNARKDGTIESVSGQFSAPIPLKKFESTVISFLERNKEVFGMNVPKRELVFASGTGGELPHTLEFQQVYNGILVHRVRVRAQFDPEGVLSRIWGDYRRGIDVAPKPSITAEQAMQLRWWHRHPEDTSTSQQKEIVFDDKGKAHLAWYVWVEEWGGCYVDAHTGDSLFCLGVGEGTK